MWGMNVSNDAMIQKCYNFQVLNFKNGFFKTKPLYF